MHFQWSIYENPIIRWDFVLSKVNPKDENIIFDYMGNFMEIIDKTGVYRLKQTDDGYVHNSDIKYIDHARKIYQETDKYRFFKVGDLLFQRDQKNTADIFMCYEDSSGVKTGWVEDILEIREKIAKDLHKETTIDSPTYPLSITGFYLDREEKSNYFEPPYISIMLHSDIWFPWVLDWNSTQMLYGVYDMPETFDELFDNQLLAQCHTPHLNTLIRSISELTKEYGEVQIEMNNMLRHYYLPMLKPDGTIDLDVKPANGRPADMYWLYE